jgi:O-antigen/teichoic acid export membrane protein
MSMAYALLAALVSSCVSYNIIGRKYASLSMSLSEWRRIAHFGSQMFAVTGVISIRSKLSEVLMGNIIGLGALGIYNRATSLDSLIWTNIHAVASKVVFVDFATLHRSGLPLRDRYLQLVEIITAMLWPAFIGFAILAKPFILAVYGSRWLPAAAPLVIIAAGSVVAVSLTMTWEVFVSSGELRTQTRIEATRTVIWLLVFCVACTISLEAAAATRLLDAAIAFFLYRPHLNRLTQTRTVELLPIFARSAALTVIAVAPAAIFMMVWHNSEHAPIFGALGCVGLGVLLWAASLQALHHPLAVQARRMLEGWAGRLRVLSSGQP